LEKNDSAAKKDMSEM